MGKLTNWVVLVLGMVATLVSVFQGVDQFIARGEFSVAPIFTVIISIVLVGAVVLRWGFLHLVKTGIVSFSSSFTDDEKAWSEAREKLVYVGVTGFSIMERFLAWCEKNRDHLPQITFFLVNPNDQESLKLVAAHRLGRNVTQEEVDRLRQEVLVSVGKLEASPWKTKVEIKYYSVNKDFVHIWMYKIDMNKIYLGFPAPGGTGMNSPAYMCQKRSDWFGLFDAYSGLLSRLQDSKRVYISTVAENIVSAMRARGLHITTVESCTGGGLANTLTNILGASEILSEAFVTYSNVAKIRLGVSAEVIDRFTVYSEETAVAMAEAGCRASGAEVGVGITGSISRVDPANPNSQPGMVYIAVKFGEKIVSGKFAFTSEGERWEIKECAIAEALAMVEEIVG